MKLAITKEGTVVFQYERGTNDIPVALSLLHASFVLEKDEEHKQYIAAIQSWVIIHGCIDRSKTHAP